MSSISSIKLEAACALTSPTSSQTRRVLSLNSMPVAIHCLTASFLSLPDMQSFAHVNHYFLATISQSLKGTFSTPVRMQMASRSKLDMGDIERYRQTGKEISLETTIDACKSLTKFTFKINEKSMGKGFPFATLLSVLARGNQIRALVLVPTSKMPEKNLAEITSICGRHLTSLNLRHVDRLSSTAQGMIKK